MKKNVALKLLTLICVTCLILGVTVACGTVSKQSGSELDQSSPVIEQSSSELDQSSSENDQSSSIDDHEHDYEQQITEPTSKQRDK